MENLNKKQKIIFIGLIIIMILVIGYYVIQSNQTAEFDINSAIQTSQQEVIQKNTNIIVHITGCVENEGIVELEEGSRIADAIEASGGLTLDANLENVNLAYQLQDGQKIKIPSNIEDEEDTVQEEIIISDEQNEEEININIATQTELETIPGIGPSTALKIIEYRTKNGKFKTIEDIKNVSGIGEAKFETIKDYICVN